MTNIFIANLDWDITSDDLNATFSAFGEVHLAHVVFDAKTKKSKGFGYVEMESAEEAIKAIQALNGFEVNGRKLDVKIASPKSNRPPKKESKPKPAFSTKKPFNKNRSNDNRGGGGGNRYGGSGNSYGSGSGNSYSSGNSYGSGNSGGHGGNSSGGNQSSGERKMRPRRKFDN